MNASHLKDLHPDDVILWLHVEAAVWRLVRASGARVSAVGPVPKMETAGAAGLCTWTGGTKKHPKGPHVLHIGVRRFIKGRWRERMTLHYILDTICHEVAHAKAGWADDHGTKWFTEFGKLVLLCEKLKIRRDILNSGVKILP